MNVQDTLSILFGYDAKLLPFNFKEVQNKILICCNLIFFLKKKVQKLGTNLADAVSMLHVV